MPAKIFLLALSALVLLNIQPAEAQQPTKGPPDRLSIAVRPS